MKEFKMPQMMIIHLSDERVICASGCNSNTCFKYYCDDCVECQNSYTCDIYECKQYAG